MQCSSCGAQNKDGAKFCEDCGKPLVSGTEEEQIDRLVDYLVWSWFDVDEGCAPPDEKAKRLLREAARDVHAKWKANPHIEDVAVKIDEPEFDVDETFDGDELDEIFSGREAAARVEDERERKEREAQQAVRDEEERREKEEERRENKKKEAQTSSLSGIVMALIAAASIGVFVYAETGGGKHEKHEKDPEPDKHESHRSARTTPATTATTTTTSTVPPVAAPVAVTSCTCVSRANGKNTFVLEQPPAGGPWHVDWNQSAGFSSMHSGFWLGASDAGAPTAVPRDTTQLQAVMACENEILAVVQGDVASAWTGTDKGDLLWTRKLPAPYAFPKDAGDATGCAPALGVTGNVFTVPLVKGKPIALSIRDGSIQK